MKKTTILRMFIWGFSLFLSLFAILAVHIYMASGRHKSYGVPRQLSRIDFKETIDTEESDKIKSYVLSLEGVQNAHFNKVNGILVYTFNPQKQTSVNVFNHLIATGHYKAEQYIVDEGSALKGCPAFTDKGFVSSLIPSFITKHFN